MSSVFPQYQSVQTIECGSNDVPIDIPTRYAALGGLSKRELFAAMAMQSIIGTPDRRDLPSATLDWPGYVATEAVDYADALLAALARAEHTTAGGEAEP